MGLLETATKAYELAKKAGNIETQDVIMQLREELLARQSELLSLKEEIACQSCDRTVNDKNHVEPDWNRPLRGEVF